METIFLLHRLWRLFIANKYMEKKGSKKKKPMLRRSKAPSEVIPFSFLAGEFGAVWLLKYASETKSDELLMLCKLLLSIGWGKTGFSGAYVTSVLNIKNRLQASEEWEA